MDDRHVLLPLATWNIGNGRVSDVRDEADAWFLQEAGGNHGENFVDHMMDVHRLKGIIPDNMGRATPLLYNPRILDLQDPIIHLLAGEQDIGDGTGPDHMKDKFAIGGYFIHKPTRRNIALVNWHRPPGEKFQPDGDPANKRADVGEKMSREMVALLRPWAGLAVVAGDTNTEPNADNLAPLRKAGFRCDQAEMHRVPTHGNWCPDHFYLRAHRNRATYERHYTRNSRSDHRQLFVEINVLKRQGIR